MHILYLSRLLNFVYVFQGMHRRGINQSRQFPVDFQQGRFLPVQAGLKIMGCSCQHIIKLEVQILML
jgi:hypothetical protein